MGPFSSNRDYTYVFIGAERSQIKAPKQPGSSVPAQHVRTVAAKAMDSSWEYPSIHSQQEFQARDSYIR